MTAIRTLIVDDEAPARQWLRSLCNKHTQIQVVGECSTAADAAQKLRTLPVDLLLLDIQLGPHTGFQVLEEVPPLSTPLVVIVSAFDQYAVTAYEKNAIDYLLKPVLEERFRASVERVQRQLRGGLTNEIRAQIAASIGALHQALLESRPPALSARLVGERDGNFYLIDSADIEFLESSGNYVLIHTNGQERRYSLRSTLQSMQERLDPREFPAYQSLGHRQSGTRRRHRTRRRQRLQLRPQHSRPARGGPHLPHEDRRVRAFHPASGAATRLTGPPARSRTFYRPGIHAAVRGPREVAHRSAPPSRIIRAKDSPARGVRASCCRRAILPARAESPPPLEAATRA